MTEKKGRPGEWLPAVCVCLGMDTTSKISEIQRTTLEGAGREIARDWQDEGGSAKALLTDGITREGDVSYLDGVAKTVGFDGGMPDGYKRPRHPAWEAVFAGIQAVADGG